MPSQDRNRDLKQDRKYQNRQDQKRKDLDPNFSKQRPAVNKDDKFKQSNQKNKQK